MPRDRPGSDLTTTLFGISAGLTDLCPRLPQRLLACGLSVRGPPCLFRGGFSGDLPGFPRRRLLRHSLLRHSLLHHSLLHHSLLRFRLSSAGLLWRNPFARPPPGRRRISPGAVVPAFPAAARTLLSIGGVNSRPVDVLDRGEAGRQGAACK